MIGHVYAAGDRNGHVRLNAAEIALHFSVAPECLSRALKRLEKDERPGVVYLQNPSPGTRVSAVSFFSSTWSNAYANVGTPYGKVHRDFHYQCMFSAIAPLVETGCQRIRVENPSSGRPWRRDAYICLMEAVRNIQKSIHTRASVHLEPGTYDQRMVDELDRRQPDFDLQEHRPVGTCMSIFEGLNMRTIFVEVAKDALLAAGHTNSAAGYQGNLQ